MVHEDRVFSPAVVFKDGHGEAGGQGAAGGASSGGEGGAGDDQQHFDRGFTFGFGKSAEKAEREAKARESALSQGFGIAPKSDVQTQIAAMRGVFEPRTCHLRCDPPSRGKDGWAT